MLIDARIKKLALTTAAIFLLIVAMLLGAQPMYLMAVVIAVVPVVSWALGLLFFRGVSCIRTLPTTSSVGERIRVSVKIHNDSYFPKFYLRVSDRLPRWFRFAGSDNRHGPLVLNLKSHSTAEIVYFFEPMKRGVYRIGPMRLLTADPIGFSTYRRSLPDYSEVVVYPEVLPARADFLESGGGRGWHDQPDAVTRGGGTDFDGVRSYRSGDELRRINWKTTARTGQMAVTEYTLGYANHVIIALDLHEAAYVDSGFGNECALEYGITIAASLASAALKCGSPVSLLTAGTVNSVVEPFVGMNSVPVILEALARMDAESDVPFVEVLHRGLAAARSGAVLVCITPVPIEDQTMQQALTQWMGPPVATLPSYFWLNKAEFQRYYIERTRDVITKRKRGVREPLQSGGSVRLGHTRFGEEFHIAPGGELASILSRS